MNKKAIANNNGWDRLSNLVSNSRAIEIKEKLFKREKISLYEKVYLEHILSGTLVRK